ncbi:uncharacterized protein LOC106173411 isoform X2 [Lingula anatina]|uniref:Uncharacterized protein LOC106173411 isoform X2 n=1 Tax=Lingula anatina TaxID=7574 RepID=A0A1S3JHY5_LINAN|nr:uncharacterized protein LOC106173411 isoform X2 [Lingula anatina]|eukprot:XP_013410002.1 uncharacterized protein LOC106173411 isoform X2 [Lingula anatina]
MMGKTEQSRSRNRCRQALGSRMYHFYGLFVVCLGVVFPLSSALAPDDKTSYYYTWVFLLYLFSLSLCFFIYLRFYLLRLRGKPYTITQEIISNRQDVSEYRPDTPMLPQCNSEKGNHSNTNGRDSPRSKPLLAEWHFPPVFFTGTGLNRYMRFGAALFATGAMGHNALGIIEFIGHYASGCQTPVNVLLHSVQLGFTFTQIIIISNYSALVINKHKAVARLCLLHTMVTHICVLIAFFVLETEEKIRKQYTTAADVDSISTPKPENLSDPTTVTWARSSDCLQLKTITDKARPILYPFIIQFSIIGAQVMYNLYRNVGIYPEPREDKMPAELTEIGAYKLCHHALNGLYVGFILIIIAVTGLSVFSVAINDDKTENDQIAAALFFTIQLVLYLSSSIAIGIGFFQTRDFVIGKERVDYFLIAGTASMYTFNIFAVISCIHWVSHHDSDLITCFSLVSSFAEMIETSIQTFFIQMLLTKRAWKLNHVIRKPGREVITFLLITNLGMWLTDSFAFEKRTMIPAYVGIFGFPAWTTITNAFVPWMNFYRFYSFTVLAVVWKNIFLPHKDHIPKFNRNEDSPPAEENEVVESEADTDHLTPH